MGVTCEPLSQCHAPGTCFLGQCSPSLPLAEGTPCDDGDFETLNDTCSGSGACVPGPRLCENVTCTPISQCYSAGVCDYLTGECSTPFRVAGARCDDGDERTTGETCDGSGQCTGGEDLCITQNVTCVGETACKLAGTCFRGVCSYEDKADNTACDDGNPDTGAWSWQREEEVGGNGRSHRVLARCAARASCAQMYTGSALECGRGQLERGEGMVGEGLPSGGEKRAVVDRKAAGPAAKEGSGEEPDPSLTTTTPPCRR